MIQERTFEVFALKRAAGHLFLWLTIHDEAEGSMSFRKQPMIEIDPAAIGMVEEGDTILVRQEGVHVLEVIDISNGHPLEAVGLLLE